MDPQDRSDVSANASPSMLVETRPRPDGSLLLGRYGEEVESTPAAGLPLASLPPEIVELLIEHGTPVARVSEVTAQPWRCSKGAFQIEFADGRLAKARLFYESSWAVRVEVILDWLGPDPALARMVQRRGRASLEEWVEGEPLGDDPPDSALVRQAGQLLARWHGLTPSDLGADVTEPGTGPILSRLDRWLGTIRQAGHLGPHECRTLLRWAEDRQPGEVPLGIVHGDFCGSNLVCHPTRGLVSIDHECMAVGMVGMDLARSLERWALNGAGRAAFLEGYAEVAGPTQLETLEFWSLAAEAFGGYIRLTLTDREIRPLLASLRARIAGRSGPAVHHSPRKS